MAQEIVTLIHQRVHVSVVPDVRRLVDCPVGLIGLRDGGHFAGTVEHRGVSGVMAAIGEGHRGTDLHDIVDLVVDVQSAVVAVHRIVLQQTLVEHTGQRGTEVGLLVTAADTGLVVL